MADRHTSIIAPGIDTSAGIADWGRKSRSEMIRQYKAYAERMVKMGQAILDTADEDFLVETYIGVHVQRNKEEVK